MKPPSALAAIALVVSVLAGCEDAPAVPLAPSASALVAPPAAAGAKEMQVDRAASRVTFLMDAPQEKIRGVLAGATTGSLSVDPSDLKKTTGIIHVDLGSLELFQTQAGDDGAFGAEQKVDAQNRHARAWLEIGDDAPEEERKKNAQVELAIRSIDRVSVADLTSMTGAERKVTLTATGDLRLHQRRTTKTVDLEATFTFDGDRMTGVRVVTARPMVVGLAEHDVRPREAFGKLAQKTLDVLAPKVAKEAPIEVDLTARVAAP